MAPCLKSLDEVKEITEEDKEFIRQITQKCSLDPPKIIKSPYDGDNIAYSAQDREASSAFFEEGFHICYERHLSH